MKQKLPYRADHLLIRRFMLQGSKKDGKVAPNDEDMEKVIGTFYAFGGSWEGVFMGSTEDLSLLKRIIKIGIKKKLFTQVPSWESS